MLEAGGEIAILKGGTERDRQEMKVGSIGLERGHERQRFPADAH